MWWNNLVKSTRNAVKNENDTILTSTLMGCIHVQDCIRCVGHCVKPYGEAACNVFNSLHPGNCSYGAVYGGGGCCGVWPFTYLKRKQLI